MDVPSFYEVESILKTLPVGYYIKRNIAVRLTNEDNTYYVPFKDEISISYVMLKKAMSNINDKLTNEDVEKIIRTLLYHEVSHAFLTPKNFKVTDAINVFEDERIETICKSMYHNVDFHEFLKLANGWNGVTIPIPKTAFEAWYILIRYHAGNTKYLNSAKNLFTKYANIDRNDNALANDYAYEVENLYKQLEKDFEKSSEFYEDVIKNANNELSGKSPNKEKIFTVTDYENSIKKIIDIEPTELFNKISFFNANVYEKLNQIVTSVKKLNASNAFAINSYSGVFNPRAVVNDDYKWFLQKNRQGHLRQFSKIKLNLFIDNSSSFEQNERVINEILFALSKIEKANPEFRYSVVTMNTKFKILEKTKMFATYGGNAIPENATSIIQSVIDRQAINYNIVLFDGDALTDQPLHKFLGKEFECFNILDNCVMILDDYNKIYADKFCEKHKRIYTHSYAEELENNICNALNFLFK